MDIKTYRQQLEAKGISLRPLWSQKNMEDGRFDLHAFGAYTASGEWLGPVIIQALEGGRDGILTYVGTKGNAVNADVATMLAPAPEPVAA